MIKTKCVKVFDEELLSSKTRVLVHDKDNVISGEYYIESLFPHVIYLISEENVKRLMKNMQYNTTKIRVEECIKGNKEFRYEIEPI